jgi:DNA-binding response OmpR family regulator
MAANSTLLCIHRDPAQLSSLQASGYDLLTATNGHDGLRLFASHPVDAIVLEYYLGLMDGAGVADEIKRIRPTIPIVMLADNLELPDGALKSVDALVTKSDGPHFLWATVHFVLNVKPAQSNEGRLQTQLPSHLRPSGRHRGQSHRHLQANASPDPRDAPFSAKEWKSIRTGTTQF